MKKARSKTGQSVPAKGRGSTKEGAHGGPKKDLRIVSQPADFFKQQVTKALLHQKVRVDESTEYYLVDLLSRFMFSENLYSVDDAGGRRQEILALLLKEAMSQNNAKCRQQGLRRLGDVSLYTAGYFSDSLSRKVVDVDYYIGMGRTAYATLARSAIDALFGKVFADLSANFHRFVDVLAEVSHGAGTQDAKNILRLYELWVRTRSARVEQQLKDAGIIPSSEVKTSWQ